MKQIDWELTFLYWRVMLPRLAKLLATATTIAEGRDNG